MAELHDDDLVTISFQIHVGGVSNKSAPLLASLVQLLVSLDGAHGLFIRKIERIRLRAEGDGRAAKSVEAAR